MSADRALGPLVHLSQEQEKQLRELVQERGRYPTATALGCTVTTIDNALGGVIRQRTRDRLATKLAELAALRTATRLRRPTPEQMKLEPSGARALVGISRVPYEAFRSMLINLSPTLSYLVDGVVLETGSAVGTQLRVKMRSVEIATYQCDACAGDKDVRFSGLFDAVAPEPYETNQDVACPYCHSPNDVRRA